MMQSLKNFLHLCATGNVSIAQVKIEDEGVEYSASTLRVANKKTLFRQGRQTPKKKGFFVVLWKRAFVGIVPYDFADGIEQVVIAVQNGHNRGYFIFPQDVLVKHGIFSQEDCGGKRGFRLYTPWDEKLNVTAQKTRKWQAHYFINASGDGACEQVIERLKI